MVILNSFNNLQKYKVGQHFQLLNGYKFQEIVMAYEKSVVSVMYNMKTNIKQTDSLTKIRKPREKQISPKIQNF